MAWIRTGSPEDPSGARRAGAAARVASAHERVGRAGARLARPPPAIRSARPRRRSPRPPDAQAWARARPAPGRTPRGPRCGCCFPSSAPCACAPKTIACASHSRATVTRVSPTGTSGASATTSPSASQTQRTSERGGPLGGALRTLVELAVDLQGRANVERGRREADRARRQLDQFERQPGLPHHHHERVAHGQ